MSKGISHCLLSSRAKRRRTKEEMLRSKELEQYEARRVQIKLEEHEQMRRQLESQREELEGLREKNEELKQIEEEVVPSLVKDGLLSHNPETGVYRGAKNWDEHQELLEHNTKQKQQQIDAQKQAAARQSQAMDHLDGGGQAASGQQQPEQIQPMTSG